MTEGRHTSNSGKPESRRDFVRTAAQVAATAPAVALLLRASTRPAMAIPVYRDHVHHILDDFTFGNASEDIDSHVLGGNFNPFDGRPQQDDHL